MADETELGRVFSNLFENARRYGRIDRHRHRQVHVTYARTGPWVIVSVRDHGPGVAPEKLQQLTTPFFRGDAARTAATGAGLGLAIVEKALQRMGGAFELANAPDGGLVAHIRLSARPEGARAALSAASTAAGRPRAPRSRGPRPPGPSSRRSWPSR